MMAALVDDPRLVTRRQMNAWAADFNNWGICDTACFVNWALRTIGKRSATLDKAAVALARRLAESKDAAPRWVGKDALRELAGPKVQARLTRGGPRGA